jgi:hypothetical protein
MLVLARLRRAEPIHREEGGLGGLRGNFHRVVRLLYLPDGGGVILRGPPRSGSLRTFGLTKQGGAGLHETILFAKDEGVALVSPEHPKVQAHLHGT